MDELIDPWGTPYFYVNIAGYGKKSSPGSNGNNSDDGDSDNKVRRDKKLKPVNTDFDLYSAGKDKQTKPPFTAKYSWDDIIRCNNGGHLGYVKDY